MTACVIVKVRVPVMRQFLAEQRVCGDEEPPHGSPANDRFKWVSVPK